MKFTSSVGLRSAGGIIVLVLLVGLAVVQFQAGRESSGAQAYPSEPFTRELTPLPVPRLELPAEATSSAQSSWTDLLTMPWRYASTGWHVLADQDLPIVDYSFTYGEMRVDGQSYQRGVAVYPFSEIVYALDGRAARFTAQVGITDDSKRGAGTVRFLVYGDEFLLHETEVVRAGDPARTIDVSLDGLQELRLVVLDAGDGSLGDYALWAEPRILRSPDGPSPGAMSAVAQAREERVALEAPAIGIDRTRLLHQSTVDREAVQRVSRAGTAAHAQLDQPSGRLVAANSQVAITLGFTGGSVGRLTVLRDGEPVPVISDASPVVETTDGQLFRLSEARAERYEVRPLGAQDSMQASGIELVAWYRLRADAVAMVKLAVRDNDSAFSIDLHVEGLELQRIQYLGDNAGLALGDDLRYLADRSHLYRGAARADGHWRRAPFEATKPALVWSAETQQGVLFTFYDYFPAPAWMALQREPGRASTELTLELEALLGDFGPQRRTPPALTVELVQGPPGAGTFARFRREMDRRYPAAPLPDRLPYQWGPWYVFGPGISAPPMLAHIDLLARHFADLGPWQVVLDAGWYVQYGRPDAELNAVDYEKFPGGVREIADAAHDAGMELILYLGTGFVHDSAGDGGEWLALRGLIERHPAWMITFQHEPSTVRRYLLDYANPEVQAYLANVLRDYFEVHGADGLLLDGMADAEGQLIPRLERDRAEGPPHPLLPTLDIYRFLFETARQYHPNPFIESSWLDPMAANPYVHVFRYGDEIDQVDHPYPFSGFLQRLDYALFSRVALGQRTYVGTATGNPREPFARWWLQAAAALGTDATISFDLRTFDPGTVAALRADLRAIEPFQGETHLGPGLFPEYFATARDGVTYLGVLNREPVERAITVDLSAVGLNSAIPYTAFDVSSSTGRRLQGSLELTLAPRSFRLLAVRERPGVLWTSSAVSSIAVEGETVWSAVITGPADVPGSLRLRTPVPSAVQLDGASLARVPGAPGVGQYAYDEQSGLLTLAYDHRQVRTVTVRW